MHIVRVQRNRYCITEYGMRTLESVSDIALGLTHPRRTKLQHGTFLRFGHPRLVLSLFIISQ